MWFQYLLGAGAHGFTCQYAHLGAGFPLASHSIKMLSRGSTMWSFTDCLVMVGGWDTATVQTGAFRASGATAQAGKPGAGGSTLCQGPRFLNGARGQGVMSRTEPKKKLFQISWNLYEKVLFYPPLCSNTWCNT